jgi:hypothetical protein
MQVSCQSPLVGLRHEAHYYVVWLSIETRSVLRAVALDFSFNCWCLKFPSYIRIRHDGRRVHHHAERLEAVQDFYVLSESHTPELYWVSPD